MRAPHAAVYVLLALVAETACVRATVFECGSADDCIDAGVHGRCESSGYCSFPDPACPSAYRYGDHAGDGLGGLCVPPDDGSTGIADTGDGNGSASDTGTTSNSSAAETTPLSDGTDTSGALSLTAEATGPASTGEATTLDPTDAATTSTTTGGEPTCPSFVDDFEDGSIDAGWSLMDGEFVSEAMGELRFELTPELDMVYPGVLRSEQDLATGEVRIHVGQAPSSDAERLYLAVAIDPTFGDVLYIMIQGAVVTMQREHGARWTNYAEVPFDARAHAWLQIRGDDGQVHFEVSADGEMFETLYTTDAPFPLLATTVVVASTNFAVIPTTAYVSVLDFEICTGE